MAANVSGPRSGPPRRARKQTQTTKSHRYEPFTKRVAKLKIDPIHKVQRSRLKESSDDISQSYFRAALDEWSELNLTTTFTSFLNKVNPLSENLPQLLHHADKIAQLLLEHIEKQDPLALEALLSLVAHLAHDLGQDFEKYFSQTVTIVAKVSVTQDDPAVVESCFTCLAWIYKYLSRLLIQDLRPLLDILLPYFSARKDYIRRFTSESLAFLLRKAAVQYSKNEKPLRIAIEHVLQNNNESKTGNEDAYIESCLILLTESAVGIDAGLHSSAPDLFRCIHDIVTSEEGRLERARALRVIEGLLISLIHRTDAAGFHSLFKTVTSCVGESFQSPSRRFLGTRMLLIIVATRSGSRISDWNSVITLIQDGLKHENQSTTTPNLIKAAAATMQFCPLDQLLPSVPKLIGAIVENTGSHRFFSFCETVARLGKTRFRDLLLPHLQKYIISNWGEDTSALVVTLSDLHELECISRHISKPGYFTLNEKLELSVGNSIQENGLNSDFMMEQYQYLMLARCIHFPRYPETIDNFALTWKAHLSKVLSMGNRSADLSMRVTLGWGLQTLLQLDQGAASVEDHQYTSMLAQSEERLQLLPFVEALSELCRSFTNIPVKLETLDVLGIRLAKNMLNTSVALRRASVVLLQALYSQSSLMWLEQSCELLIEMLDTSYSISNARQLGMLIRRLPILQKATPREHSLSTLLPLFILGLIPHFHDQLRKDLTSALGQMLVDGIMEELAIDVIRDWLQAPPASGSNILPTDDDSLAKVSPFECSKLREVDVVHEQSVVRFQDPQGIIQNQIESAHALLSTRTPVNSRSLALQVLIEIPQVAEKRSKIIVPAFLAAQRGRAGQDLSCLDESQSVNTLSPDIEERGWSLKERKLFLQLIGQFNNPRVLYRADDVRAVLFDLLSNGDAETRKLSLLALLRWKDKALLANREALLEVAEDNKTTSELGTMLNGNEESDAVDETTRSDLLSVLLRLVFGQLIGRVGVPGSQEAKRKSMLRLIFRMRENEVLLFLDILKGRLRDVSATGMQEMRERFVMSDIITDDQQYGFLRMCLSMLEILQTQFSPFGFKIIDAVLYCTIRASRQISAIDEQEAAPALLRNIRRAGIQCLNLIFEHCPQLELDPYMPLIFSELIQPRLPKFVIENAQGVSGLLKMFSIWAKSTDRCASLCYEGSVILKSCWGLLGSENTKSDVKVFILIDIIGSLLDLTQDSTASTNKSAAIIQDEITEMLNSVSDLLQQNLPKDLLFAATKILQRLAGDAGTNNVQENILKLLIQLLREPTQRLPPHVKAQVLKAIEKIVESSNGQMLKDLGTDFFDLLSSYFDFFRDLPNRETCCRILKLWTNADADLVPIAEICYNLNASSTRSLDEIDHDKQDAAFASAHSMLQSRKPTHSFLPVLHNLIFLTRTSEETAIRGNALSCLKHFISEVQDGEADAKKLQKVLLQAVRKQMNNDSETVRADFVEMLGAIVKHWESEIPLQDMNALLVGDDEEASFFNNILHIQSHRRNRAMRRLTSQVEAGFISAENVAEYFLPLLQKFANDDSTGEAAQSTKGQSVASIMVLLQWLDWKSFRKVFRQYRQLLDQKKVDEKIDVRLLSHAADALTATVAARNSSTETDSPLPHLAKSLPSQETISSELKTNFISKLTELSHYKDEGEVNQRIPAAVVAVKLIKLLPKEEISLLASPVALDVAQVLRSRTQETRDLARNKLAEIVGILGSGSMQFVLKELRNALTRGYQLHVLSYTMHTMLLATAETRIVGDLDYCIEDLVAVILDDIFGVVGQEKDNQDYISSMKEVKRNKSFDSMEILAKCTSVKHLAKLVLPFESLLAGSLTTKQVRNVDELFRRIGVGISHSPAANSQELLVFAFELIKSFYRIKPAPPSRPKTNDEKNRERFIVQKDNVSKVGKVTSSSLLYKIAKFAIDIARSTFARHSELMTLENVHGFVPIIGDALIEGQEDVKISALRLLSTVIKLKLPEFDENAKLYVMEAVKVVKSAVSTNEEAAQASLKLVAAILREKRDVEVRESDVAYLLKRTMPDLEEPDRQGVTFGFVKAIMARKMQISEVYELVDQIGLMMVTSQGKGSRDAARGVYVHFLLDYPQGKTRWTKQIKFLVKNLEYQHPEGRQSVMEAISNLYTKLDAEVAQETAAVIFIPLVLRMSNDENLHCREMAGALLAKLFRKTTSSQVETMLEPLRGWLEQEENMMLKKLSLQTWSIYFNAVDEGTESDASYVRKQISSILKNAEIEESDWEVKYQAMELMAALVTKHAELMLTNKQQDLWTNVVSTLSSNQTWLQQSASSLIGLVFRDCITAGNTTVPLTTSHGLKLNEEQVIQLVRSFVKILKYQSTSRDLAQIVIQNLVFLGRCVIASDTQIPLKVQTEDLDGEGDIEIDNEEEEDEEDTETPTTNGVTTPSIPAIQYVLDQATATLRREPPKQTSTALTPKSSFTTLLTHLISTLQSKTLTNLTPSLTNLLLPTLHLISPNTPTPRSSDPLFTTSYTSLIESTQLLLDAMQSALGDQSYMRLVTSATKIAREKRMERRSKRAFEVVAEPERAAREKRRKVEKKKERRKEVKGIYRGNRRKDLGF